VSIADGFTSLPIAVPTMHTLSSAHPILRQRKFGLISKRGAHADYENDLGKIKRIGGVKGEAFDMFGMKSHLRPSFNTLPRRRIAKNNPNPLRKRGTALTVPRLRSGL